MEEGRPVGNDTDLIKTMAGDICRLKYLNQLGCLIFIKYMELCIYQNLLNVALIACKLNISYLIL